jgi:hypothetical protein
VALPIAIEYAATRMRPPQGFDITRQGPRRLPPIKRQSVETRRFRARVGRSSARGDEGGSCAHAPWGPLVERSPCDCHMHGRYRRICHPWRRSMDEGIRRPGFPFATIGSALASDAARYSCRFDDALRGPSPLRSELESLRSPSRDEAATPCAFGASMQSNVIVFREERISFWVSRPSHTVALPPQVKPNEARRETLRLRARSRVIGARE